MLTALYPVLAQQQALTDASASSSKDAPGDPPVIVIKGRTYPVEVDAKSYVNIGAFSRQAASDARFFSQCVKPIDNGSLHELIDGAPNREIRAAALSRIIRGYMACYPGTDSGYSLHNYGDCNPRQTFDPNQPICQAFYDRGALVEKMLTTYAPDLFFTTAELVEPAVLGRFHARESRLDKTRTKSERVYAEVAACLVATHPELALDFPKSVPGSEDEAHLRTALIGSAPECVGGTKEVTVDPEQFRIFIDDALYSWATAVRGTKSLIPDVAYRGVAVDGWRKTDF